ncbi:MAG: phosphate acyltransferase PlsX [Firmicutes bacterium]|nr:phosphate acyltransferase PlsX [Bacillota bacterium]MBQ9708851.1 phosphate acyltransferase PlsX [Bacillota bacterium]
MRVVLDGMGGDNAPMEIVKGAVQAAELIDDEIIIVGPEDAINKELKKNKYKGDQIRVVHASEAITMEDSPVKAIRRKTNSSLVVALNMIKDGEGDLLISGGNTGALVVGSRMVLGRIDGIDRPVLASVYINLKGEPGILVDAGASSESKAGNLLESGLMGSIYLEKVWGRPMPKVGLVNLGVEETKGTSVTKEAYQKLKKSGVNFVGNIEGREVPVGAADVIVCDGFVGNVILKLTEGLAMSILGMIKEEFMANGKSKVAGLLMKGQLASMKSQFNYEEYGGAPVLGVQGPVLKIHGSSNANAVKNAIIKGIPYAAENVVEIIRQSILDLEEDIES